MSVTLDASMWFPAANCSSATKLRLFCFPYAGGSTAIFNTWGKYFPESVQICPVHLPGRGTRFLESPIAQFSLLINSIVKEIGTFLDKPFAFFGHSLGALVAFEITHQLRCNYSVQPAHLIVSGCTAPRCKTERKVLSKLPDRELLSALRQLNGTPHELLENEELMILLLPSLRADFALYESYQYQSRTPLACPLTVLGGALDREVDWQQLALWKMETTNTFSLHQLPGDHFFLHSDKSALLRLLLNQLKSPIHAIPEMPATEK